MLTRLRIRNFKCLDETEIPLGRSTVLSAPNGAGKTSVLQALTIWSLGAKRWHERFGDRLVLATTSGVTIGRQDLVFAPVPHARMLWRGLVVQRRHQGRASKVHIVVDVDGNTDGQPWRCGLEFGHANSEVVHCRPVLLDGHADRRTPVPTSASALGVVYVPPLTGVIADEVRLPEGGINVRLGEGRTAELLRNMCHGVLLSDPSIWGDIAATVHAMFGIRLNDPYHDPSRGEVGLDYQCGRSCLDISCAGQGLRQALFLMACVAAHPNSVLLLDAPDTHLDAECWSDIYGALKSFSQQIGSQPIATGCSSALVDAALHCGDTVAALGPTEVAR